MEKEIEKYKGENDNEKVERLEGRISKIKEVREKINSAKFKDEIKNILDSEFKHRGIPPIRGRERSIWPAGTGPGRAGGGDCGKTEPVKPGRDGKGRPGRADQRLKRTD